MKEQPTHEDEVSQELSDFINELRLKFAQVETSVVDYTRKNPIKTIGFAMLAGVIAAQLFRKKDKA